MVESADYYNTIARGYNLLHSEEQLVKLNMGCDALVKLYLPDKKTSVLDVGCGTGISSDYWAQKFSCDVLGIDPAGKLIAQNTMDLSEFVVGSAEKLPFADASFDLVVSFTAIQNFSDITKGLMEMVRVGRKWFVFTTLTGTPDLDLIRKTLNSICIIKEDFLARNDTVFICCKK